MPDIPSSAKEPPRSRSSGVGTSKPINVRATNTTSPAPVKKSKRQQHSSKNLLEDQQWPYSSSPVNNSSSNIFTPFGPPPPLSASIYSQHGHGRFPHHADSLRNLAALSNLVDARTGWYESHRVDLDSLQPVGRSTDEDQADLEAGLTTVDDDTLPRTPKASELSRSKRAALREYYERQNEILDGWREADEVLDSQFPTEVMRRFGDVEDDAIRKLEETIRRRVAVLRASSAHIPSLAHLHSQNSRPPHSHHPHHAQHNHKQSRFEPHSPGGNSGNESDEEESDPDFHQPQRRNSFARAAGAFSGLWSSSAKKQQQNRQRSRTNSEADEGSALLASSQDLSDHDSISEIARGRMRTRGGGSGSNSGAYGSTVPTSALANTPTFGMTTIDEPEEISPKAPLRTLPPAGNVRSYTPDGKTPTAIENDRHSNEGSLDRTLRKQREVKAERDQHKAEILTLARKEQQSVKQGNGTLTRSDEDEDDEDDDEDDALLIALDNKQRNTNAVKSAADTSVTRRTVRSTSRSRKESKNNGEERTSRPDNSRQALLEAVPGGAQKAEKAEEEARFAININLAVNVLLLAGKGVAVLSSGSVSLLASLVDSALDLLSTVIIFATSKIIAYRSWKTAHKYPVGKKRLEPLGVVVFSVLMIASFCQVLVESIQRLANVVRTGSADSELASLPLIGIIFMVATIGIKAVMWWLYRKSPSSGVRAVAQDAENDVVFNVASLIFPIVGQKLNWPALDPIGGALLSIYIISEWLGTLFETITKLSGAVGPADEHSRALYLVTRFQSVRAISAFDLYHSGDDCVIEVDIVLPPSTSLKDGHDTGEVIQYCLESLDTCERDYNPLGQAGHLGQRG